MLATLLAASLMLTPKPAYVDTLTVTNTNDGIGSLRRAIGVVNANPGADTSKFDIPEGEDGTARIISPLSALPAITGSVTIDGYSQPGLRPNSKKIGATDAVILVELSGSSADLNASGLKMSASNVVVRELVINHFSANGKSTGTDGW